jgi:hypothetical protein
MMDVAKSKLQSIIQEELENILKEFSMPDMRTVDPGDPTSTSVEYENLINFKTDFPTEDELGAAESIY